MTYFPKPGLTEDFYAVQQEEFSITLYMCSGAHGSVVVKALCYKPEGRGFDIR
jgi:hypothetical protein